MDFVLDLRLQGCQPPVTRRVRVPGRLTLRHLHRVVSVSFGWGRGEHLYEFEVAKALRGEPILLEIWRSLEDTDDLDDSRVRLKDLLVPKQRFLYRCDVGAEWTVELRVVQAVEAPTFSTTEGLAGTGMVPPDEIDKDWGPQAPGPVEFDLDALNRRLARLFPGGRQERGSTVRPSTAGPPPLTPGDRERRDVPRVDRPPGTRRVPE